MRRIRVADICLLAPKLFPGINLLSAKWKSEKKNKKKEEEEEEEEEGKASSKSYELVQVITNSPPFRKILYLISNKQLTSTLVIKSLTLAQV